jgi:hypothetical protein
MIILRQLPEKMKLMSVNEAWNSRGVTMERRPKIVDESFKNTTEYTITMFFPQGIMPRTEKGFRLLKTQCSRPNQ